MRIGVVLIFLGVASTALAEYAYTQPAAADLPSDSNYPDVGSFELHTFAPNTGLDSYGLETNSNPGGLNKEYFHYSAPEEEIQGNGIFPSNTPTIRKNLRVVFIKAPENNGAAKTALRLAKQAASDMTAIFVLSKQTDPSDLAKEINEHRSSVNNKPEVRFVKYRTPEEAISAQLGIQRQYEALRGTSRSINEGVAPVLDFASSSQSDSSVPAADGGILGVQSSSSEEVESGSAGREYIPPSL